MLNSPDINNTLAADTQGLAGLKQAAKTNTPEAIKAVSKQFEAVFMNMMLKSMRDATPQDGMLDNDQSRLYTSMLDQQISQSMASKGIGLGEMLARQLSRNLPARLTPSAATATPGNADSGLGNSALPSAAAHFYGSHPAHVLAFKNRLQAHAEAASRMTGIPAKFMLGQAALESGWGRKEILAANGESSHNLFGMKATPDWHGKTVEATTTEYVNGVARHKLEKFRAYDNYADSFRDYANMLSSNPRYRHVIANSQNASEFAHGLQQAGYATDPHYAVKLTKLIDQSFSA